MLLRLCRLSFLFGLIVAGQVSGKCLDLDSLTSLDVGASGTFVRTDPKTRDNQTNLESFFPNTNDSAQTAPIKWEPTHSTLVPDSSRIPLEALSSNENKDSSSTPADPFGLN